MILKRGKTAEHWDYAHFLIATQPHCHTTYVIFKPLTIQQALVRLLGEIRKNINYQKKIFLCDGEMTQKKKLRSLEAVYC